MSQKLKKFLHDIETHRPINLSNFETLIKNLQLHHYYQPSDIQAHRKKDKYIIDFIHPNLWSELIQLAKQLGEDRVTSARQNRSHQHKVNGSLMLVRQGLHHPQVVLFDNVDDYHGFDSQSATALIIENRELFIHIEKTLNFIKAYCTLELSVNWQQVDIIFGMGNEVSNALHQSFLSQYQRIYLLLDFDLGGVIMAKNLLTLLPNTPQIWLQPYDIEDRLQQVIERCDIDKLNAVINLGQNYPSLQPICQLIAKHHKFLEQESYLYAI